MSQELRALFEESSTAFSVRFDKGIENAKPTYEKVATVLNSNSGSTGYGWLGDFPTLKEWIDARQLKNLSNHQYSIVNKLFESSVKIKRTDYEDNDYGRYGIIFESMGYEARMFPDEHVFGLLSKGFIENCYDGVPFFSDQHPLEKGGVVSNMDVPEAEPSDAWYLLDTSRPLKPLIWQERVKPMFQRMSSDDNEMVFLTDSYAFGTRARGNAGYSFWQLAFASRQPLTEASFEALYSRMMAQKNSEGRSLKVRPTLLVVPVSLRAAAEQVILRERLANGESNTNYKTVEILVAQDL